MKGIIMGDTYLTVKETAKLLKINTCTIYNGLSKKTFPIKPSRLGRSIRFPMSRIQAYMNEQR